MLRSLLYATVASFPFEMPALELRWQVPQVTSSLFLVSTLLQPGVCYRRLPGPLWAFGGFLYAFLLAVALHDPIDPMETAQYFVLVTQALVLFWAASNLLRDGRVARGVLWAMAAGALVWGLLPMLGVGRTAETVWTGGERITAFGQNANRASVLVSTGILALFGVTRPGPGQPNRWRLLVWPFLAVMALAVIETGSRGGLLSLMAGLLVFVVFPRARTLAGFVRAILTGAVAIVALGWSASRTEVMRHRLEATAETHTMSGREDLFPALWDMFLERPVTGWGPVNNQYEVAIRAPFADKVKRDAHNLGLELLTATGLVGAVPCLVGLGLCAAAAWRGRRGPYGAVPLALLATFMMANMSGNHLALKPFWLGLALAVAAGTCPPGREPGA
ncbi:MAG TPA: O-antigen ligase family protein [bacterium]|nr:O-antigen ligase family protein [bacterium]